MSFNVISFLKSTLANKGAVPVADDNPLPTAAVPRLYRSAGTAMTRPANTTAYAAGDSVSDNATAGSVTANPVTLADAADAPFTIERIKLTTPDTGPAAAGATFELVLFDDDPTANSGVGGGDNATYSQKGANCIGVFIGTFKAGTGYFSDRSIAWLTPADGNRVIARPKAGTQTVWWQIKTLTAFTPSANSTTFTPIFEGFPGRA